MPNSPHLETSGASHQDLQCKFKLTVPQKAMLSRFVRSLWPRYWLRDTHVKHAAAILTERLTRPEITSLVLANLGEALVLLLDQSVEAKSVIKKAVREVLEGMEQPDIGSRAVHQLGYVMSELVIHLPQADRITAWCQLECRVAAAQHDLESRVQAYLDILKDARCVREGRAALIRGLEKITNEDFTPEPESQPSTEAVLKWVKQQNANGWQLNLRRLQE
jgi:hypothetical protein